MYQAREPVCHSCFLPPKNSHIDSDFHDRGLLLWVSAAAVRLGAEMFWAFTAGYPRPPCRVPSPVGTQRTEKGCILRMPLFISSPGGHRGFAGALAVTNPPANAGDNRFDPWVRKIPWRRKWQPAPVSLPGESYGQRSLVGYSTWGHKRV